MQTSCPHLNGGRDGPQCGRRGRTKTSPDWFLVSEDHVREPNDRKAGQRRDNRDRGDPIRLLELTKLPVGHIRLSSNCSTTQPYDPSKQTPDEGCYAEEHKHGHHQQTRSPTGSVARLIIRFIMPGFARSRVDDNARVEFHPSGAWPPSSPRVTATRRSAADSS
jgi:hypothetical protein